ncbi:malate dehydrogenase [Trichothermofontia sichuanensis B231]|uniref:malate dehydrogenase n=1 Tax=Trichothermofontia sichuanensis TaxID=3045816 RepID=UPI0022483CA5|nr:malate dehydrogenase [Trichothermofontia sichuanensis B231]
MAIPPPDPSSALPRSLRVSIIGAGRVGSTLAQRIVEKDLADVVLLDIDAGLPQGIALDLLQARGIERHDRKLIGTANYGDTIGSDVVVITAGFPRQPGMDRSDLLRSNAEIVVNAARQVVAYSPNAILLIVTNPLDVMTYLAWKTTGLPSQQVMGMAGVLDSARLQTFISLELGVSSHDVIALVLGGHGDLMVPLPRYCSVGGVPITELMDAATIARLVERTRRGGTEIVELMQKGGAYFAPASSACLMLEAILRNESRLIPVSAYVQGEYGLNDVYIGVPCRLDRRGIVNIVELELSEVERSALHLSAHAIRRDIDQALGLIGHLL